MNATKLTKGRRYDKSTLVFVEWSNGEENKGYRVWEYFTESGEYLGADDWDTEPLFSAVPESADLMNYATGERIREATSEERRASIEAATHDGGAGVIAVDGRRCYVD